MNGHNDRDPRSPEGGARRPEAIAGDRGAPGPEPTRPEADAIEYITCITEPRDDDLDPVAARITRHEAEVLYRYWWDRGRRAQDFYATYEQYGGGDWRLIHYSLGRLEELGPYLGRPARDELAGEAEMRDAGVRAARERHLALN